VFGVVYDSVARAPIAGAAVQLIFAAAPEREAYGAATDAHGNYRIISVPAGRYVVGFQHQSLDSLALTPPLRSVDVIGGESVRADLAIPSPSQLVRTICGRSGSADSTGLLIGILRDARTGLAADSGAVHAQWQELALNSAGFSRSDRELTAAVGHDGWFALCGFPAGTDVAVQGWSRSDSTGLVAVSVPVDGLARRDLSFGGTAVVRGTVISEHNLPIPNARIRVVGRENPVPSDSAGNFRIGAAPAGSQTLETRALGYAMEQRPIVLAAGGDTTFSIRLTSVKQVLDTFHVIAQRVYNRDSFGFEQRRKAGWGTFFDEQDVRRRRPYDLFTLLYDVPSLQVWRNGFAATILMRSGLAGDKCVPEFYVDGWRMPQYMLRDLDMLVSPDQLLGMEVYQANHAPPQFQSSPMTGCGSIVIWTRPLTKLPKKKK
jgi:hypothetical protein